MSKKSEIMKIWHECFPGDSPAWRRMFFDAAYVDDEALTATDPESGAIVSSLLLLPYSMTFYGRVPGVAYIYGAGTLRKYRARGYMSKLMREALREAADRGDTFVTLIPARESLEAYYAKFGFSTVFYARPERYTSLHHFPTIGAYDTLPPDYPLLYSAFERMMAQRPCCVQHTRAQFLTLMDDMRMSGTGFAAVSRAGETEPAAMVWASPEMASNVMRVRELIAEDDDAANAVLNALKQSYPRSPLTIWRQPSNSVIGGNFIPRGMARVVNPENALEAVAGAFPQLHLTLRLRDDIIPENSGVYKISGGQLSVTDAVASGITPDLDLTPAVLTSLLFSSAPVGEVMGLPGRRPQMSLMLD